MQWSEICRSHPDTWLVVEALDAHTTPDLRRHLDCLTVVEECPDGKAAMKRYRLLHQQYPEREFYFIHSSRDSLDIQVRQWLGIRASYATDTKVGAKGLANFDLEVGGMDYGFAINGILGMDFLTGAKAIINLHAMRLTFNG